MLTLEKHSTFDFSRVNFRYIQHRGLISRVILPITRWMRARFAERYIQPGARLLDLGCGDGYFLRRNQLRFDEVVGLDRLFGDDITSPLPFQDDVFDYVTLLAVIEHLDEPSKMFGEIRRVLKKGGKAVFTTPKHSAAWIIHLYAKNMHDEHKHYFDLESVKTMAAGFRVVGYDTFFCGLNQVFCLEKL